MTAANVAGLYLRGKPAQDHADNPCILMRGQNQAYNGVSTASDVLRIQNYTTDLITVDKDGQLGIGVNDRDKVERIMDINQFLTYVGCSFGFFAAFIVYKHSMKKI